MAGISQGIQANARGSATTPASGGLCCCQRKALALLAFILLAWWAHGCATAPQPGAVDLQPTLDAVQQATEAAERIEALIERLEREKSKELTR